MINAGGMTRPFEINPECAEKNDELTPASLEAEIREAWNGLKRLGAEFVRHHEGLDRKGQKLFDRVFRPEYLSIDYRIHDLPEYKDGAELLLRDIMNLALRVRNYSWNGAFCTHCGDLIKKDEMFCEKCQSKVMKNTHNDRDYSIPSSQPTHRPKKPGSAAKRGHGHKVNEDVRPLDRKKGKGGRAAR